MSLAQQVGTRRSAIMCMFQVHLQVIYGELWLLALTLSCCNWNLQLSCDIPAEAFGGQALLMTPPFRGIVNVMLTVAVLQSVKWLRRLQLAVWTIC